MPTVPIDLGKSACWLVILSVICLFPAERAWPAQQGSTEESTKADWILILKSQRELRLIRNGKILKSYPIALGRNPVGTKRRRGDGRTPEGLYLIDGRNAESVFTRSLHISYPNIEDRAQARAAGDDPGDRIMIHGMPEDAGKPDPVHFFRDWTDGCVAVGNTAIMEIWDAVADGTPVIIRP